MPWSCSNVSEPVDHWPRAAGPAPVTARLRARPEDFVVEELLTVDFTDDGEFDWLWVEKRDLTTEQAARTLTRFAGLGRDAVSWSGLKDRQAVTRQWFSVHLPGLASPDWNALDDPRLRILASHRHRRKLRRGTHRGNAFILCLRELQGDRAALRQRLEVLAKRGVPNYFGEQRFGRDGGNLRQVREWFLGRGRQPRRHLRGLLLSAARAWLFNRYLAGRVESGVWDRALPGDVLVLGESNSVFRAEPDARLRERLAAGDIHPAGPLPGVPGNITAEGEAAELEAALAAREPALLEGLQSRRVERGYRALRVIPRDWRWRCEEDQLTLAFSLPTGCFATAVVRELANSVADSQQ